MVLDLDPSGMAAARRMMVDCQVRPSDVTKVDIVDAMLWAPREQFMPRPKRAMAYVGEHVEVAPCRFELDPRVFGKMLDAADPQPDDLALIIGGGGGYAAAVLSRMVAAVVSLEEDAALAAAASNALAAVNVDNVMVEQGPLTGGCAAHQPYNLILVYGGVADLSQSAAPQQLADGGRLVSIAMDGALGRCEVMVRSGDAFGVRRAFDASAPLLPGFGRAAAFTF